MLTLDFTKTLVKKGTKVKNEAYPELRLLSTYNSFQLNGKAMDLLGVGAGDRIILHDAAAQTRGEDDVRFYICKGGQTVGGVDQGSLLSPKGSFSYSVIWGAWLANKLDVKNINQAGLMDLDLIIKSPNAENSYIAKKVCSAKIEPLLDEDEEVADAMMIFKGDPKAKPPTEDVFADMFVLTGLEFKDHDPQVGEEG